MKKITLLLLIVSFLTGCTRFYLGSQPILYKVTGEGAMVGIYSNKTKTTKYVNVGKDPYFFTEVVRPGDTVRVIMYSSFYHEPSKIEIQLGSQPFFTGSPDHYGVMFVNEPLTDKYFRLK